MEGEELFRLVDSYIFSSLTARFDSVRWRATIVLGMHYFSNMVDSKESLTNWSDLFDLAMAM